MAASSPTLKFSGGTLVLEGYGSSGPPQIGADVEWVWDSRVRAWRCDAIVYPALRGERDFVARIADAVPAWQQVICPKRALRKLRPDQEQAVARWNQTGRGCIVMPTGTGKTEVALHLIAASSISTLVVAP